MTALDVLGALYAAVNIVLLINLQRQFKAEQLASR